MPRPTAAHISVHRLNPARPGSPSRPERRILEPCMVLVYVGAFVDSRIEVDEMPAGLAGGLHDQLDVALAVEGTGIADIVVVTAEQLPHPAVDLCAGPTGVSFRLRGDGRRFRRPRSLVRLRLNVIAGR